MCGIFGIYTKNNNAENSVFNGLKKLEYRGYDSWGIASRNNNVLSITKRIGKISDVKFSGKNSNFAIGHSR
jgi:glucosamine--fructose-6-phosphate aminotransferase (isomerizing)